ncbi:transcriptional regulator [Planococcus halocryophilus Or1]|uniref:IclR family transcriptional regulator n=1 Tax=Planococcus halocryophilus TaxID=1215089 RepID=UPI0002B8787D|nr:IclR family transcriptional regulator [Planococcus halocryophilus]EMF46733.1 transcriptional regulator [Planococcus halocryophilus Or1]
MPIIQSVERALRILDLFDEYDKELKLTEITEKMNLHKSTVHSLLKTLQKHHYIEQNSENGKYFLGMKLFERGHYVIQNLDLQSLAREQLVKLSKSTGRTVHLVILDGKEGIYIDKVESAKAAILYSRIGRRVPIHSSGVGKALVAFKDPSELEKILDGYEYTKQTKNTLTNEESFLIELEKVRKQGYAIDDEENEPGVYCVALPIRDYTGHVIAAISSSTTASNLTKKNWKKLLKA